MGWVSLKYLIYPEYKHHNVLKINYAMNDVEMLNIHLQLDM